MKFGFKNLSFIPLPLCGRGQVRVANEVGSAEQALLLNRTLTPPLSRKAGEGVVALILFLTLSTPARAITIQKNYTSSGTVDSSGASDAPNRTLADFIKDYVDVPKGGTDWKVFSKTKEINVEGKTKDGYDYQYFKPKFTPEVRKLDGQIVTIKGFMFPLGETEGQKLFLFGPFPVSCPFHYHVSPSLVIEVHADKHPIKFSYDPVTIRGKLQLVNVDPENSTFYKLVDAEQVK